MSDKWKKFMKSMDIPDFYEDCSMENCDLLPEVLRQRGLEWIKSEYKESMLLHGCAGSGKTWFATALCRSLCEMGCPWMIFKDSYSIDEELLDSFEMNQERSVIQKYQEVPVLFIDDLGVERSTERTLRQYWSIINKRVTNSLLTVITSNLDKQTLRQNMGDRIVSRMELFLSMSFPMRDLRKKMNPIKTKIF